jgi:gliding motility-associated-like protein
MKHYLLTALFLLLLLFEAGAQLKADFTVDKQGGCSPLLVQFTNTTTGASPTANYQWEFGNGNTSVLKNPGAAYLEEKVYTITLTVNDGSKTDSKTQTLTVYKKPLVDFTISPGKGCLPLPVSFMANASPGDGSISTYDWDFGDGSAERSNQAQTTHTYSSVQKAGISLTVTNSFGCYQTLTKADIVDVKQSLTADFAVDQRILCRETDTVQLTDYSKGPGTLTYLWNFGDGQTSTEKNPRHSFQKKGSYSVSLTVNSSEGCTANIALTDYLNVANYKSGFNVPTAVCRTSNSVFDNTSTPLPASSFWLVDGNPVYSYGNSFNYSFYTGGQHRIMLKNTFGSCLDSVEKIVSVKDPPILKAFLATLIDSCGAPAKVAFKDTTTGAVAWKWNFDSYLTQSTQQAPTYTFSYDNGYYVQLEVANADGCKATIGKPVYIQHPDVKITSPDTYPNGEILSCGPKNIHFAFTSSVPLRSVKWDFGDNSTATDSTPVHYYGKAGVYYVKLLYTTTAGCNGETKLYYPVGIHEKPKAEFSISQTTICGNTPVTITNNSTTPANLPFYYYYQWNLGNGYFQANTGQINNFIYQFQDSGTFDMSLIVTDLVCADTLVKKGYVKVLPPFPKIGNVEYTCDGTRGLVTLNNSSKMANSWQWDFGDGHTYTPSGDQPKVQHTYTKTGGYKVILTTTNGQCTVKDSSYITVLLKQNPVLSTDKTEVCSRDDYLKVTISNLEKNPWYNSYGWGYGYGGWQHRDGSYAPMNVSISNLDQMPFSTTIWNFSPGKQDLRAVVYSNYYGCTDTTNWVPLKIKGPLADFSTNKKPCATGNTVYLQDQSRPQNGQVLKSWEWNFGDGKIETYTTPGEISHTYVWPGTYYVTLKVTDAEGCYAYSSNYVLAENNSLRASFTTSATFISPGTTVQFTNTSVSSEPDNTTYKWLVGDGTTATTTDVSKQYSQPGVYTVKLIATNTLRGCADTASVQLTVKYVNAAFTFSNLYLTTSKCPPVLVQFTNTSANISRISWDFGDGVTSTYFSPSHIYTKAGKYYVTVKTYSDNGTVYTTRDSVFVGAPSVQINADRFSGCTAQTITFKATNNASVYWWDFGDGSVQQTTGSSVSHDYNRSGSYAPGLLVKDTSGCTVATTLSQAIVIDSLFVAMKNLPVKVCTPKEVLFESTVAGASSQTSLRYHWDYGTGNSGDTSNLQKPSFTYTKPGKYPVRLTVFSNTGCVKQTIDTVTAFEGLGGIINGPAEVCEASSVQFSGATQLPGQPQWQWIFHDGTTANTQKPPDKTYDQPGNYIVKLIVNNNGCADTISKTLGVNPKPVNILSVHDAIVCEGSSLALTASGGATYQWSPAIGLNTATSASVLASPINDISYKVVATTTKACSNSDSIHLKVIHPFTLSLPTQVSVCEGSSIELKAAGANSYQWIGNMASLSNTTIANPTARPVATTTYTVVGKDAQGCFQDTATISVVVNPLPSVDAGPDLDLLAGTLGQLKATASNDVISWNWTPADYLSCTNCPSPETKPLRSLTYSLTVQNAAGCVAIDTVSIHLLCSGSRIFIPNTFTPNGDGRNDRFRIKAEGIKQVKSLRIYNRWGEVVFERTNFSLDDNNAAWNGKYNGQYVPAGTYVYFAELTCNEILFQQKGTITVVY